MGEFTEFRAFLLALFPQCFLARLPPGTEFDVCVADLMQWLSGMVRCEKLHAQGFNAAAVVARVERAVAELQNNENDPSRPLILTALVCLLDTTHQVPLSKGATQRARDTPRGITATTESSSPHMNEARYNEMVALNPEAEEGALFIENVHQAFRYPLRGAEVWRSVNLKLQLYRLVTMHLLHASVREGRVLVVDDGLAFEPEVYAKMRAAMLSHHDYGQRTPFEQECLVAHLMTHSKEVVQRFIVYNDGSVVTREATGSGEADIKVLHYLQRGNGARRFLVVNQDTDLIFILLLHMERLLWRDDQEDDDVEVWLDSHSPTAKPDAEPKPYRYLNVKALYHAIRALFAREFPGVRHPVETLCYLAFSRKTDFVAPWCQDCPGGRGHQDCLCVRDSDAWNLFAELHTDPAIAASEGYLLFKTGTSGGARSKVRHWDTAQLHGLINNAVTYDWVQRRFLLRHKALARFHYLVFQEKLMRLRLKMRLPVALPSTLDFFTQCGTTVLAQGLDADELCIYGQDVADRLELCRRQQEQLTQPLVAQLVGKKRAAETPPDQEDAGPAKKFKPSSQLAGRGKLLRPQPVVVEEEEGEEWMQVESTPPPKLQRIDNRAEEKMSHYLRKNADVLRPLTRFAYKPYHGVPSPKAMRLRLYDVELYMDYCRDGWRQGAKAAQQLTQKSRLDDRLQVWPYEERLITDPEERARALNSTYYASRYNEASPHYFDLVEVRKSENVFHTRYCE